MEASCCHERQLFVVSLTRNVKGQDKPLIEWAWVERELAALLHTSDTTIVTAFVLGLVSSHRATQTGVPGQAQRLWSSARRPQDGAHAWNDARVVEALQPFLQEHSERFWHELRSFTASAFSMPIYDRLVKYSRTRPLEQKRSSHEGSSAASAPGRASWLRHERPADTPSPSILAPAPSTTILQTAPIQSGDDWMGAPSSLLMIRSLSLRLEIVDRLSSARIAAVVVQSFAPSRIGSQAGAQCSSKPCIRASSIY
ncbi:hypothetical protein WJX84_001842 [Apatococcus fuscideae]|uniref:RING-type E3 ubiquitin transferase n=1 Tax=Apatococcus fuscideae TaxID=2026836 RepID=A0AAW1SQZ9_9CHLO